MSREVKVQTNISMDLSLQERFDAVIKRMGMTRSGAIQYAIRRWLGDDIKMPIQQVEGDVSAPVLVVPRGTLNLGGADV